ncbi:MAG TPA: TonB-dependent receptor [Candidatus Baltobacteraceae bacterium]|nr:TonB-dependent receptor [Candidatus Baltobacteraceae bacterium]
MKNALGLLLVFAFVFAPLQAPAATTGTVTGTVVTTSGVPVAGADVTLEGPSTQRTVTDAKGAFQFTNVLSGLYSVIVTKAGFNTARNDDVAAFIGQTETVSVTLAASSFSSLRTIASVSTNNPGRARINTSTAAVSDISNQVFVNQGQQQVTKILNETPGIITTPYNPGNGNPSNGDSPASQQTPQIRGALSYETESLIDGHPVSVGAAGSYSPNLLNPWLLQNVELVKGPGSLPTEINYAINGTINYRTLDPTAQTKHSVMFGYDNWGGISTGFKATGFTADHKLGYAVGYVSDGAPGPLNNFSYDATSLPLGGVGPLGGPYYLNGQQIAMLGNPIGLGPSPSKMAPYDGMGLNFVDPVVGCCYQMNTGYHSLSELVKFLFNFSNNTSFTFSYLGGQNQYGNGDPEAYSAAEVGNTGLPAAYFAPCGTKTAAINCNPFATGATYDCASTSGPACNSAVPFDVSSVNGLGYTWTQQNLFQGEFRTTIGSTGTLLARHYEGSLNQYAVLGPAQTSQFTYSLNTYGTIPLCPTGTTFAPTVGYCFAPGTTCSAANPSGCVAPVNTTFTGQKATYSTRNEANSFATSDTMRGDSVELQEMLGQNDTVTLGYDRSEQGSSEAANEPSVGIVVFSPAVGSKQTFQTISLRGDVTLNPKVRLNLGDYAVNYLSHYSIDNGKTFNDSTHTYNEPRAALEWRPNVDTAYRFSAGGSVAPPFISLVSSGGSGPGSWSQVIGGVPAAGWAQTANNGDINAETAFSYDLGFDRRIQRATALSLDLYSTQLQNLFLDSTTAVPFGSPAAAGCPNAPCLVSKTENLGHARYQGIELALNHTPIFGLGWTLQGSLQRAYTYNLPPYFYCAGSTTIDPNTHMPVTIPPGPGCINNTNLAVIPNVNFGGQATALAGAPNGIGSARIPYALGYGELNWTGHSGQYYNLGLTYFGNNNSYNHPAFTVLSANARWSIGNTGTSLQLSADNLTGAYSDKFAGFFNGNTLPLVNGAQAVNPLTGAYQPVYAAATPSGNYGPASFRVILVQDF